MSYVIVYVNSGGSKGGGVNAPSPQKKPWFIVHLSAVRYHFIYSVWLCRPIMVISTNLISAIGGRKVSEFLTSNIYRYSPGMNNQNRYAESTQ